jgi:hypothetical protein
MAITLHKVAQPKRWQYRDTGRMLWTRKFPYCLVTEEGRKEAARCSLALGVEKLLYSR